MSLSPLCLCEPSDESTRSMMVFTSEETANRCKIASGIMLVLFIIYLFGVCGYENEIKSQLKLLSSSAESSSFVAFEMNAPNLN